jgi:hypothetical protein
MGIFVLNYIDNIIGIAPSDVADSHFHLTVSTLKKLRFRLSNSKIIPTSFVAVCLGISFNIQIKVLHIPTTKLPAVLILCNLYISEPNINKRQLQALIGSLMFLHKTCIAILSA